MREKNWRYPIINAKNVTILSLITIGLISLLVFIIGHKSFIIEFEITLSLLSISLFLFLSLNLFRGVRLKNQPIVDGEWKAIDKTDYFDVLSYGPDITPDFDIGEGIGGIIIGIISWIILTILLLVLLFLLANVVWGLIFILAVVVYWIFYRALRQVFIRSRKCKGKLIYSIGYGFWYSFLYTSWLYGAIEIYKRIH